jgi:hypothetical protein
MPAKITPQQEGGDQPTPQPTPRSPGLRVQAILTIKVLLIAGGTLGVLTLLDRMVRE